MYKSDTSRKSTHELLQGTVGAQWLVRQKHDAAASRVTFQLHGARGGLPDVAKQPKQRRLARPVSSGDKNVLPER